MDATNFTPTDLLFIRSNLINWDYGTSALKEILNDPDCDKATALLIYWRCDPNFYYGYATEQEIPDWSKDNYRLMKEAERMLLDNRFPEIICYTPDAARIPKDPSVLGRIPEALLAPSHGTMDGEVLTRNHLHAQYLIDDCKDGNLESVKKRLEAHPDILNLFIRNDNPLLEAMRKGHVELVTYLLEKGARMDIAPFGQPPLPILLVWVSGKTQQQQILELLVKHGADIKAANAVGKTVLHHQLGHTPQSWARCFGPNLLKATLRLGADPHAKNAAGETPLDLANKHQNEAAVKIIHAHLEKVRKSKATKENVSK